MSTDFPADGRRARGARRGLDGARDRAAAARVAAGRTARRCTNARGWTRFLAPLLADPSLRIVLTGAGTSAFIGDCLAPALAAQLAPARRRDCDDRSRERARSCSCSAACRRCSSRSRAPATARRASRPSISPSGCSTTSITSIVTCNADGALARRARTLRNACVIVLPDATNDRGFAMTSSFSSMLLGRGARVRVRRDPVPRRRSWRARRDGVASAAMPLAQRLVARRFERVVYLGSNALRGLAHGGGAQAAGADRRTDRRACPSRRSASVTGRRRSSTTARWSSCCCRTTRYARAYDRDLLAELRRDARAGGDRSRSGARCDGLSAGERARVRGHGRCERHRARAARACSCADATRCGSRSRSACTPDAERGGRRQSRRAGRHDPSVGEEQRAMFLGVDGGGTKTATR